MEKLNRDVLNYIVNVGELKGKDLVSFSLLNTFTNRSINFIPVLKEEFEIYNFRVNPKKYARELYIKMYKIKRNYKILRERMEILNLTEVNIHDDRPVYNPTYLYELLYAKYTYDACPFLSSIFEETDEMRFFYDHVNILISNTIQRLTKEECMIKYGSERAYHKVFNEKRKKYKKMDLENIWFNYMRVEDYPLKFELSSPYGAWENAERREGTHINKDYIDSLWDDSINILSRNLMATHKKRAFVNSDLDQNLQKYNNKETISRSFLEYHIQNNYKKCLNKLTTSDYFSRDLIDNCKKYFFQHDIYRLTHQEINLIISLHDLVVEGIISITMPIAFLL